MIRLLLFHSAAFHRSSSSSRFGILASFHWTDFLLCAMKLPLQTSVYSERLRFPPNFADGSRTLFSNFSPDLSDSPQILIPNMPLLFQVSVLPNLRLLAWRNDRSCAVFVQRIISFRLWYAPSALTSSTSIASGTWLSKSSTFGGISHRIWSRTDSHYLLSFDINRQMQFAPCSAFAPAVRANFPLAFAIHFHARRIYPQMQFLPQIP